MRLRSTLIKKGKIHPNLFEDAPKTMNIQDQEEWDYRYHERLGIMCGTDEPTPEQVAIAKLEADQAIAELAKDRAEDKVIQRDLRLDVTQ